MTFYCCVANASLTQRILKLIQNRLGSESSCATVIFLNDFWIIRITLTPEITPQDCDDCRAILQENSIPYQPTSLIKAVFQDLDHGEMLLNVMNRHQVVILSNGLPNLQEISVFQQHFISGLGYCPPSLV